MTKSNTQTIEYLYPTTNTPLLTKRHALIVCEALRCVCPCDDDRDALEDDCEDVSTSDQFSRKQTKPSSYRLPQPITTKIPSLTTHHTLIVCEALRCVCSCDDDRDAKDDDCEDVSTSDQFSRKHLRNATM